MFYVLTNATGMRMRRFASFDEALISKRFHEKQPHDWALLIDVASLVMKLN